MPINLLDVCAHFTGKPWQVEAIKELDSMLDPRLKRDDSPWVQTWRKGGDSLEGPHGVITPELMERLTGYPASSFNEQFCNDFNLMLEYTGFDSSLSSLQMLLANLLHESCGFVHMKEIDPGYYLNGRDDIGNIFPGDGPKFRGCGPLQVTGRYAFERFYKWLRDIRGIDDKKILEIGTDYVADAYPFQIAISWIMDNDLLDTCLTKGFDACCYRINGGWNGKLDRDHYYEICKKEILSL